MFRTSLLRAVRSGTTACLLVLISAAALGAQESVPSDTAARAPAVDTVPVSRATSEIEIDARLEESAWEPAAVVDLPYEWTPGDNTPAPVATECRITYDAEHLYLGCTASDPEPERIRAHLADRDDVGTFVRNDHLLFMFDTFHDQRRAFQFRVNPLGVQFDALFSQNEGFEDFSWDAIWDSDGRITERGYVVEAAIPFKSLSLPSGSGPQSWGVIVGRSYPRSVRHRLANHYTDLDNSCLLCQAEVLTGISGVQPGANVEVTPSVTSLRSDRRPDPFAEQLETGDVEMEPSLDLRWRLTTNMALNATANPDFSQVEADAAQLEVNRRFALFFPEKRSFFLEDADLFQTPENLVFTRTVVDPSAGVKLSGKSGANAVGVFGTRDEVNRLVFPGNQASASTLLEDAVTGAVARYRRDVGPSSSIGGLATVRAGRGYENEVAAADAFVRLSAANTLRLQAGGSRTAYPAGLAEQFGQPEGAFGGYMLLGRLQHSSRDWTGFLELKDLSTEFRADAGFLPRVDLRGGSASVARVFWGSADRWYSRVSAGVSGELLEDHDGLLTDRSVGLALDYMGPMQSRVSLEPTLERRFFAGEHFDLARADVSLRLQPSGDVNLGLTAAVGDGIDFGARRQGDLLRIGPSADLRVGRPLELGLDHTFERLAVDGRESFRVNLTQLRLLYHLDVRTFVRAILQYRDRDLDSVLHAGEPPEQRSLFSQLLFSYKMNPETVLFVGYSDDRLGLDRRDLPDLEMTQQGRTFFLKLGYAFRP